MVKELAWRLHKTRNLPPDIYKMILIDTKPVSFGQNDDLGHYAFTGGTIYRDWEALDLKREPSRLIIYRPLPDLITPEGFDGFFNKLLSYQFRPQNGQLTPLAMTVIIDELIDIASNERSRMRYIEGFTRLLVQGRSSLQTLWILTQYPAYIDPSIKRNTSVTFLFRLPDPNDRKTMSGVMGLKEVETPIRTRYGFFYQNAAIDRTLVEPLYYTGVADEIGANNGRT